MNEQRAIIEFYTKSGGLGSVRSTMVPPVGSFISIRKRTYRVERVTYALDHSDDASQTTMRANVDLFEVPESRGEPTGGQE